MESEGRLQYSREPTMGRYTDSIYLNNYLLLGAGIAQSVWRLTTGWTSSSPVGGKNFHFTMSRPALGPIQPPVQWVPGVLSWGKASGLEPGHSPPSSAEFKSGGAIPPLPHTTSWHSA
jgi:hypothetical protein